MATAASQQVELHVRAFVDGVENITHLGGALGVVKTALMGLGGALFVDQLKEMAFESDKAAKNTQFFSRVMLQFGQDVDSSRQKVNDFAMSMGVSRNEMQNTVATLVKAGLDVEKSMAVVERALDSATQRGIGSAQALGSLEGFFSTYNGYFLDGLAIQENFGDTLSKTERKVLESGKAFDNTAKAIAAYDFLMKVTEVDMGTHAMSLDGLNGVVSQQESLYRELRREIGGQFLPVLIESYKWIISITRSTLDWLKETKAAEKVFQVVSSTLNTLKSIGVAFARTIGEVADNLDVLQPTADQLMRIFIVLEKVWVSATKGLGSMSETGLTVRDMMGAVNDVTEPFVAVIADLVENIDALAVIVGVGAAAYVALNAATLAAAVSTGVMTAATTALGAAGAFASAALAPVVAALGAIGAPVIAVAAAAGLLYLAWKHNFLGLKELTTEVWEGLKIIFGWIKDLVVGYVNIWKWGLGIIYRGIVDFKDGAVSLWQKISSDVKEKIAPVKEFLANMWDAGKEKLNFFKEVWVATWQNIKEGFEKFTAPIRSGFAVIQDWFQNVFGRAFKSFTSILDFAIENTPVMIALRMMVDRFALITDGWAKIKKAGADFFAWLRNEDVGQVPETPSTPNAVNEPGGGTLSGVHAIGAAVTGGRATLNESNLYRANRGQNGYGDFGHDGYDFRVGARGESDADKLYAGFTGMLTFKKGGAYGNHVELVDALGQKLIYAHLKEFNQALYAAFLRAGRNPIRVGAGEFLGLEGNTGNSKGAHLHLGAYDKDGKIMDLAKATFQSLGGSTPVSSQGLASQNGVPLAASAQAAQLTPEQLAKQVTADQKRAVELAKEMYALQQKIAAETDKTKKAVLQAQLTTRTEEINAWKKGNSERQTYFAGTMANLREQAKTAESAANSARIAARKASDEARDTAESDFAAKKAAWNNVLKQYELERAAVQDNADKRIAVETAWKNQVITARKQIAAADVELSIQSLKTKFRTDNYNIDQETGKATLKVSQAQFNTRQEALNKQIAALRAGLVTEQKKITQDFEQTFKDLSKSAFEQNQQLQRTSAGAALSAAKSAADLALSQVEQRYAAEMQAAGENAQARLNVEKKYQGEIARLRTASLLADKKAREEAERIRFEDEKKSFTAAGKAVPDSIVAQHNANMKAIAGDYTRAVADNQRAVQDILKRAKVDAAQALASAAQQEAQITQQTLANQLARGKITWEAYEKARSAAAVKSLEADRDAQIAAAGNDADKIARIRRESDAKITAERIASEKALAQRTAQERQQALSMDTQKLRNQLEAQQIMWEQYETNRLKNQIAGIEAQRKADLTGLSTTSAEYARISRQADLDIQSAKLKSQADFAKKAAEVQSVLIATDTAALKYQLENGEITRQEYADRYLEIQLRSLNEQRASELRSFELTTEQRAAIDAKYVQEEKSLRAKAARELNVLLLQIEKDRLDARTAQLNEDREAGRVDAITFSQENLQIALERMNLERDMALETNQDGADGVTKIWENYFRNRAGTIRRALEEEQKIELEMARKTLELKQAELQNRYNGREIGTEQYEAESFANSLQGLEQDRQAQLAANKEGMNGMYRIWQEFYAKRRALEISHEEQKLQREYRVEDMVQQNMMAELQQSLATGLVNRADYEASVYRLQDASLDAQYQREVDSGKRTAAELGALWSKLLIDKDNLHIAYVNNIEAREIATQRRIADVQSKSDQLGLMTGSLSLEDYEDRNSARVEAEAYRKYQEAFKAAEGNTDLEGAAWTEYSDTVAADTETKRRAREQRAFDIKRQQIGMEMDLVQNAAAMGVMTAEAAEKEILDLQKKSNDLERDQALAATGLTEEQKKTIRENYRQKNEILDLQSEERMRQRKVEAHKRLLQTEMADLQDRYQQGTLSLDEYLRETEKRQLEMAKSTYDEEMKAAGDNAELKLAAEKSYQLAVKNIVRSGVLTRAQIERAAARESLNEQLSDLEQNYKQRLIGEEDYLAQKRELQIADMELQRQAEKEANPKDAAAIDKRYDNAIRRLRENVNFEIKEYGKSVQQAGKAALASVNDWDQITEKIRELNEQLALKGLSPETRRGLEMQKMAEQFKLFSSIAKTSIGLVTTGLVGLGAITSEVAGQWASDLTSMVDDIVAFGSAIARGDYLGAAIQALTTIFSWFSRNKQAAEEARKATEEYNKQFKFSQDGYGTRSVEKYSTGFLFWQTDHYKETVNEEKKALAMGFESAAINGISGAYGEAIKSRSIGPFKNAIRNNLKQAALSGLIEAFLNTEAVKAVMGPLTQMITDAFASGDKARITEAVNAYKEGLNALDPYLEELLDIGTAIEESLGNGAGDWLSSVQAGMSAFINGQDPLQAMYDSIRGKIQQAIIDGVIADRLMKRLQPFFDELDSAMTTGEVSSINQAIAALVGQLPGATAEFSSILAPLVTALNTYLPNALNNNTTALNNTTAALNAAQFHQSIVVDYGAISRQSNYRQRIGVQS